MKEDFIKNGRSLMDSFERFIQEKVLRKKQCDQDCVIDGILAEARGIDVIKEEIDNMKREHRDVSGAIRNLKIKLAVLQANINRREESLDLAITEFERIKINTGEEEPLENKEAELESLKRTKSELLFAMTSLVYRNNEEFNRRLDVLNDKIEKLEQDIEHGE